MGTARKIFDHNYNDLLLFVSDYLPGNWCIELRVIKGEASLSLYDPHENYVDCGPGDGDAVDYWVYYVNYAREAEGLDAASWDDYWAAKDGE